MDTYVRDERAFQTLALPAKLQRVAPDFVLRLDNLGLHNIAALGADIS